MDISYESSKTWNSISFRRLLWNKRTRKHSSDKFQKCMLCAIKKRLNLGRLWCPINSKWGCMGSCRL